MIRLATAAIALLLWAPPAFAQTPNQQTEGVIDVKDIHGCGLITRFPGDLLNPNCFQQSTNLLADRTGVLTRRQGYAKYNAVPCTGGQPIRGMWPFSAQSGIQYLVMASSNSMFYSPGDGSCTVIPGLSGVLTASAQVECVQSLGYLWCTDGVDPVFATNVTSTQAVSQAPTGYHIGTFRNRILVSGVPGSGSNGSGSQVYLSGELNGLDYTIPGVQLTTSPAIISVNGINDGAIVTCLMGEFQNQYLIGRAYDLWGLSGYDISDFTLRKVSDQVGCLEPKSVQEVTNVLYWLSYRGVEGFTGTQINRVSYPIDANIIQIISAAGNNQTQSLSSQADWESGNLSASGTGAPVSAVIVPGSVVPSSVTIADVLISSGSCPTPNCADQGSIFTGVPSTYVYRYEANVTPVNDGWTRGQFTVSSEAAIGGAYQVYGGGASYNSKSIVSNGTYSVGLFAKSKYIGASSSDNGRVNFGLSEGVSSSFPTGKWAFVEASSANVFYAYSNQATGATGSWTEIFNEPISTGTYSTYSIIVGTNPASVSFWRDGVFKASAPFTYASVLTNETLLYFSSLSGSQSSTDFVYFSSSVVSPGPVNISTRTAFTSRIIPTTFSTTTFGKVFYTPTAELPSNVYSVRSSTSPNNDMWSAYSAFVASGEDPKIPGGRYYQYRSSMTWAAPDWVTPSPFPTTSLVTATTGYYITPCILVSTPTSYGNFIVDAVTNGGSFTFWISTGATCANATNPNTTWTPQLPGSVISVSTATTYIAARVLFSITTATQAPALQDMTFSWTHGGGRPPTASAQWDDRYLLFYTTSTSAGAANDHAFVYDQNQKWQLWDDEFAASAALYQNTLYTGDSAATGFVYQQDIGQSDNGNAFTMTFQTADFDGGDPNMLKQFSRAYIIMGAPSGGNGAAALSCNYAIDGSSLTYSLGSITLSESPDSNGYFVAKMPFPVSQPVTGHWLNLTCSYSGTVGPIAVHRIRIIFTSSRWD